jgi:hypothetical protein
MRAPNKGEPAYVAGFAFGSPQFLPMHAVGI